MGLELWHNPRCSKSRAAKEIVDAAGVDYVERRYLDNPPTKAELEIVLTALGKEPWDITRMGEDRAKELGLKDMARDRAAWIDVLVANPVLIERPILVRDDRDAVLGRPPEDVKTLL